MRNLKKVLLSGFVIAVFLGYALRDKARGLLGDDVVRLSTPTPRPTSTPTSAEATPSTTTQTAVQTPTATPKASTAPAATPKATGKYKDGTYTGSLVDVVYGNVQVQAVISGGKITDVKFLAYPNDRSTSREISNQAMPLLTAEAIQAQSAQVDGVSGATQTSSGFVQSLGAALQQAKI